MQPVRTGDGKWRRTADGKVREGCCCCGDAFGDFVHLSFSGINLSTCVWTGVTPQLCHFNEIVSGSFDIAVVAAKRTGTPPPSGQYPFCYTAATATTIKWRCDTFPPPITTPTQPISVGLQASPYSHAIAKVYLGVKFTTDCVNADPDPVVDGYGAIYYFFASYLVTPENFCYPRTLANQLPNKVCGTLVSEPPPRWRGLGHGGSVTITPL